MGEEILVDASCGQHPDYVGTKEPENECPECWSVWAIRTQAIKRPMKIRLIPGEKISPAAYNPRKDLRPGDPEYERLKKSINRWDLVEPLVWNIRTGNLVGGHQRFKILNARGDKAFWCSVVDLSEEDEKALNLALNEQAGKRDKAKTAELLSELSNKGWDLEVMGFSDKEFEKLFESVNKEQEEKPEVEFSQELLEEHQYVVLYFDNSLDWTVAQEVLGVETVKCWDSKPGYERKGKGRVLAGGPIVRKLQGTV